MTSDHQKVVTCCSVLEISLAAVLVFPTTVRGDRRVLCVMLYVQNSVDQLRMLVASDQNTNSQLEIP